MIKKSNGIQRGFERYGARLNADMDKCFSCGKPIRSTPYPAATADGDRVAVGSECFVRINASREAGYQPPTGGPALFLENLI